MELAKPLNGLLRRKANRRDDFDRLVAKHHKQAFNIAYRMAGNHADAEDITQEAFLRAYRFFDRYNREMPFENWLYRIISNVFIDELRKKPRWKQQSLDAPVGGPGADSEIYFEIPDPSADPQEIVLSEEMDEALQKALLSLPDDFRMTVILADVEGLSYEEISEAMRCSLGTVRSRLHRGRRLLRKRIDETNQHVQASSARKGI